MRHPWRLAAAGLCLLAATALSVERSATAPAPAQCAGVSPSHARPPILDDLLAAQPPQARAGLAAAPGTPAGPTGAGVRGRRRSTEAGDVLPHQRG